MAAKIGQLLLQENETLKIKLQEHRAQLLNFQEEKILKDKKTKRSNASSSTESYIIELEKKNVEFETELNSFKNLLNQEKAKNRDLENEMKLIKEENSTSNQSTQACSPETIPKWRENLIDKYILKIKDHEDTIRSLEANIVNSDKKITALMQKLAALSNEKEDLFHENESLKIKLTFTTKQNEECENLIKNLESSLESLKYEKKLNLSMKFGLLDGFKEISSIYNRDKNFNQRILNRASIGI